MNSFKELIAALMPDGADDTEVFYLNCGKHELTARDGSGKAVLEVRDGDRCASREYDYSEAFKVLSALRDGSAALDVWFPPVPVRKKVNGSTAGKIFGLLFGSALALFSGFCGFAILMSSLFSLNSYGLLFILSMQILFTGWFIAGVALVWVSAKGKLTARRFFGAGGGFVLFTTLLALILGIWSTRANDPVTPLADYIGMTIAFGLFAAAGAAWMIYTLRTDEPAQTYSVGGWQRRLQVGPSALAIMPVLAELRERTACEAISIKLDFDRQPALFESKLGGLPYWDASIPYPCDERSGDKLALLAQINLSELPENNLFPREGMLQFFIRPDIEYGLTSAHRVVYHKTVNRSVFAKEMKELGLPGSDTAEYGDFPVVGELAMSFETATNYMTNSDGRFSGLLERIAGEMGVELFDGVSCTAISAAGADDMYYEEGAGHRMGGYPYFTQDDPRGAEDLEKYDFLLLQIDTDDKAGCTDKAVMWGDAGVGQFFISSEALKKMMLNDTYYTWDCC